MGHEGGGEGGAHPPILIRASVGERPKLEGNANPAPPAKKNSSAGGRRSLPVWLATAKGWSS